MQYSKKILLSAIVGATVANADIQTISLVSKSSSAAVDGYYVGAFHEGAALSYLFLSDKTHPESYIYDDSANTLELADSSVPLELTTYSGNFAFSPNSHTHISFDSNNQLLINGTIDTFYACHNTSDEYNYSQKYYAVVLSSDFSDCEAITIVKNSSNSTSASSSSAPSSSSATIAVQEGAAVANAVSGSVLSAGVAAIALLLL